jgi:multiple sugar transport system substrate-binding protein
MMSSKCGGPGSFGRCLKRLRLAAGLNQQDLAERSGISVDAISGHETGRKRHPQGNTVSMLADGLGLGPAERKVFEAAARCDHRPPRSPAAGPVPMQAVVFLSHTSELDEHPSARSFVAAAEAAAIRAGHVPSRMDYLSAADRDPADYCTAMVARADVYVGIIGLRYGSAVRNRPELSYTELEFETATAGRLPRLVFLVREETSALPPASQTADHRARQEAFRRRLQESGVTTAWISTPAELEVRLYQALVELRAGADGASTTTPARRASVPAPPPQDAAGTLRRPTRSPRAGGLSRRRRLALAMVAMLSVLGALTIVPRLMDGQGRLLPQAGLNTVEFVGSQAQPPAEYRSMKANVLNGFDIHVDFNSQQTAAQDIQTILQEQASGISTIDVTDMTHSDLVSLQAKNALMDLTPVLLQLQASRQFPRALLELGRFGTDRQYYIPWLQATYMMIVNKKALPYLPRGADVDHLSYDQLVAWGQNIFQATGQRLIGLPAELTGPQGGMLHRFLQGYVYPSYTGTTLTDFRSPEAVQMWQMLQRLWAVTNPQSTTYTNMRTPLVQGQVWIAWDHQARLEGALDASPNQFEAIPAPSGPKGLGYMTAVVGLAIPKGAQNVAGAEALINWLTRPTQQAAAGSSLGFFPVIQHAGVAGSQAEEYAVDAKYRAAANGIESTLPAGLGARTDEFTRVYQDTFDRIVVHHEDIQTVLNDERLVLQRIVNDARAPCWLPDPSGKGPCQIE